MFYREVVWQPPIKPLNCRLFSFFSLLLSYASIANAFQIIGQTIAVRSGFQSTAHRQQCTDPLIELKSYQSVESAAKHWTLVFGCLLSECSTHQWSRFLLKSIHISSSLFFVHKIHFFCSSEALMKESRSTYEIRRIAEKRAIRQWKSQLANEPNTTLTGIAWLRHHQTDQIPEEGSHRLWTERTEQNRRFLTNIKLNYRQQRRICSEILLIWTQRHLLSLQNYYHVIWNPFCFIMNQFLVRIIRKIGFHFCCRQLITDMKKMFEFGRKRDYKSREAVLKMIWISFLSAN